MFFVQPRHLKYSKNVRKSIFKKHWIITLRFYRKALDYNPMLSCRYEYKRHTHEIQSVRNRNNRSKSHVRIRQHC